ncbi:2-hydroxyacid dehydrogenase [Pollutimonas bauzanensis]|uniref:Glyoxylate/hydroxypyruvate reductase A n=1 Tax=Pollutimonas bauzanensis TaxID=658167 RepID=A0A1M5ZP21_9BURK|nr:glyoxylate/hydroxypyruvate reductase A [Pollutimonas bauzanensis]SHI25653.1 glyoxylate/hydroxypyruvate reductase A [Pollutimonas bauzanensis]
MTLLVKSGGEQAMAQWREYFAEFAPGLPVRWWNDPGVAPEEVDYVLVWEPEPGRLANYPNLRLILSSGAGVDHILADPRRPAHIDIVRMSTRDTEQRMAEYVSFAALSLLRDLNRIIVQQAARRWDEYEIPRSAAQTRAGVMGMGSLGASSAVMLRQLGFITAGWSQSRKSVSGVESFAGWDEFPQFLSRTDILVCLLPDTPQTRGIIRAETISRLAPGAGIVNAGRGAHVVMADLISALDSGQLGGAILDVFEQEPLPAHAAPWRHPKILVTPHIAASPSRRERASYVAGVIAAFEAGLPVANIYDPVRGY